MHSAHWFFFTAIAYPLVSVAIKWIWKAVEGICGWKYAWLLCCRESGTGTSPGTDQHKSTEVQTLVGSSGDGSVHVTGNLFRSDHKGSSLVSKPDPWRKVIPFQLKAFLTRLFWQVCVLTDLLLRESEKLGCFLVWLLL